jgi:hypothetical protein
LILEGGFDEDGNFIFVSITNFEKMKECFRLFVYKYFKDAKLLSSKLAKNHLLWKNRGVNIDNSTRIAASDNKERGYCPVYGLLSGLSE